MKFYLEQREYENDIGIVAEKYNLHYCPAHWHLDIEIITVLSGILIVGFNLQTFTLSVGDLILIPGGNIHYFEVESEGQGLYMIFSPTILNEELNGFSRPLLLKNKDTTEVFSKLFYNIRTEIHNLDTAYTDFIRSYLGLLSAWLMRNCTTNDIIKTRLINTADLDKVHKLFDYIENNYNQKITSNEGAEILHFSVDYFNKYFKALTGMTFFKYISSIRIQTAKNMLMTTNIKITEAAHRCGFENIRTFNREFKSWTGFTPSECRNRRY